MGIRNYKPTTPGRRGASVSDFAEITRSTPEKSLIKPLHGKGGRNAHGRITTRHKGGGHKRAYRVIDFRRNDKDGVNAKVAHIEYDPNRTANIALLHFLDGEKRYIIAPQGLSQGDVVESGANADIKPGNNLPPELVEGQTPSTKSAKAFLGTLTENKQLLVVIGRADETGALSVRNLPGVHVLTPDQLNTYDVLKADDVVFSVEALNAYVRAATPSSKDNEVEVSA